MDELDLRILRHMGMDPWAGQPPDPRSLSPSFLADQVGTTPETVRERVKRMEKSGVIAGYQAYPEPGQLGLRLASMTVAAPEGKERRRLVEDLCLADGMVEVHDLHGDLLLLVLGFRTDQELDRRARGVASRAGAEPVIFGRRPLPEDLAPLSHLDWRIVRALRGHADRSPSEVAEEVGVSYRTVKRRLDRMREDGDLVIAPQVKAEAMAGVLPFDLVLFLDKGAGEATLNQALQLFPERQLQRYPLPGARRPLVMLFLYAETLAQVEEMKAAAAEIDGVTQAHVLLTRTSRETGWLDEQIELKVQETAPDA